MDQNFSFSPVWYNGKPLQKSKDKSLVDVIQSFPNKSEFWVRTLRALQNIVSPYVITHFELIFQSSETADIMLL